MSLLYLLFQRVLGVAALRLRSREFKELEIVVLPHELAVLRRQVARPRLDERDRVFLAAASRLLIGKSQQLFFVRPDALLGWHRQLVRRRWTYAGRRPGRPSVSEEIRELVLRLARENPRWGYQRIVGELAGAGVRVSATSVATILREEGLPPADARARVSWREFLRTHAASTIACDFFTVETLWLGRLYVLFFLELGTRRVHLAGCSAKPDGPWAVQQARQFASSLSERSTPTHFLIHDRDSKFSRAFDDIFRSEGVEIIRTPFRAPNANAFAERWIGTVRRDCLDRLLVTSRRQLEHVLRVYVDHYNRHRPHRALDQAPPIPGHRYVLSARTRPTKSTDATASADSFTNTPEQHDGWIYAPHAYDLRHSFVSLLIAEGRSIVEVARQAGHSATMALDTYGHIFDELDGAERSSAEQAIRKARAEARATLVRPAPNRVARKKNDTPRVAGLS